MGDSGGSWLMMMLLIERLEVRRKWWNGQLLSLVYDCRYCWSYCLKSRHLGISSPSFSSCYQFIREKCSWMERVIEGWEWRKVAKEGRHSQEPGETRSGWVNEDRRESIRGNAGRGRKQENEIFFFNLSVSLFLWFKSSYLALPALLSFTPDCSWSDKRLKRSEE